MIRIANAWGKILAVCVLTAFMVAGYYYMRLVDIKNAQIESIRSGYQDQIDKLRSTYQDKMDLNYSIYRTDAGIYLNAIKRSEDDNISRMELMHIKKRYRVVVYCGGGVGDWSQAQQLYQALLDENWHALLVSFWEIPARMEEIKAFKPDFILLNGLFLDSEKKHKLLTAIKSKMYPIIYNMVYGEIAAYDGFIISESAKTVEIISGIIDARLKEGVDKPCQYIVERDAVGSLNFKRFNFYDRQANLVLLGTRSDGLRASDKYSEFMNKLARKGYFTIHGPKEFWLHPLLLPYWRGFVEGNDIYKIYQQHGVSLVLHSQRDLYHFRTSLRIIEPIAAGAIVICDNNPKVKKYFGDSVLYFDQTKSADEIAEEIDAHMVWIRSHPKEAGEMVDRAHQVVKEHFSLDKQLKRFAKMHEYILMFDKKGVKAMN